MAYFIGIDVGTQGARVVLLDEKGQLMGSHQTPFALTADNLREQDPEGWWRAVVAGLQKVIHEAARLPIDLKKIKAVSVTSTSGTVIPLDAHHRPLHPALMYSDDRSQQSGQRCREVALNRLPKDYRGYLAFNSSSGLAKMVWFVETFPERTSRLAGFIHAADFIIGKLSNKWGVTDETNALKSGYDLHSGRWPDYLTRDLPLRAAWLPAVVPAGTPVGSLDESVAGMIGLGADSAGGITVAAAMTDGCASQVASGAMVPGSWNTTIGTTLVIKGVTKNPVVDPEGRLYNHHHPEGYWMPGGASNTGADWVSRLFTSGPFGTLDELETAAAGLIPSRRLVYPLLKKGERFPFIATSAQGFGLEKYFKNSQNRPIEDAPFAFAAGLEGVAYLEKMAFQLIRRLSGETIQRIYTAGGGSNSPLWLKIRSAVLNLPVFKMENVSGAVGAAILAASKTYYESLSEAVANMVKEESLYLPDKALSVFYQEGYVKFVQALGEKGYIDAEDYLSY